MKLSGLELECHFPEAGQENANVTYSFMSTPPSEMEWMFVKRGLRHYVLTCWLLKQQLKHKTKKCHLHVEVHDPSPFTMKPL